MLKWLSFVSAAPYGALDVSDGLSTLFSKDLIVSKPPLINLTSDMDL